MLLENNCTAIPSINVHLVFDNTIAKDVKLSKGDLICVEFNKNGCRRRQEGTIVKVNCDGNDPRAWYIILDSSNDFDSCQVKIAPTSILDVEVIKAFDAVQFIESTNDYTNIKGLKIINQVLYYTQDGISWKPVKISVQDIEDEEGTAPDFKPSDCGCGCNNDSIIDESGNY